MTRGASALVQDTAGRSRHAVAALRYARVGWRVLPLHNPTVSGACSCENDDCAKPGKHPRTRHGLRDASTNREQVMRWWADWPEANIGVATGRLTVIDVDGANGQASLAALQRTHEPLPSTLRTTTARGAHLYFDAGAQHVGNSAGRLGEGLDVRGRGGYVIVPPSLHASGHRYRWARRAPLAPLPAWVLALLTAAVPAPRRTPPPELRTGDRRRRYFAAALHAELEAVATAQPGTRNATLNRAAFRLAQLAAAGDDGKLEDVAGPLLDAALSAGLREREALATINSGLSAGQRHPRFTPH